MSSPCPCCGGAAEQYEYTYTLPERRLPAATLPELTVVELRWRPEVTPT